MRLIYWIGSLLLCTVLSCNIAVAQMPTSVKQSTVRSENPKTGKEWLILPYAFSSETMGLTFGLGGMIKGYGQDQLTFAATVFASNDDLDSKDDAAGFIGGMWDLRVPYAKRLFISAAGSDIGDEFK